MKLSKQERIGALIILAVVILALGAFLLIKPKFEEIGATTLTLATKQTELKTAKEKAARKGQLRTEIEAAYQQGEHLADMFFPELTAYEADDAFRTFVKQCKLPIVVEEITVNEPTTSTLSVSFFDPTEVSYDLKSYVSQGMDSSNDDPNSARETALRNALSGSQTIGSSTVDFTLSALSIDDVIKFVDEVNNYFIKDETLKDENTPEDDKGIRKAIAVNALSIPYDELNAIYEAYVENSTAAMEVLGNAAIAEIIAKRENPNLSQPLGQATELEPPIIGGEDEDVAWLFTYSDSLTFYSIERMQDPKALLNEQDGIIEEPAPEA